MLKRNLSLIALSTALAMPALAHEFSFGAGALSNVMFGQLSLVDTTTFGSTNNDVQWSATGTTITGEFYAGYAYNINKGFDIGAEIFYQLAGPEIEQWVINDRYTKYSINNLVGVRVVPGFNITPSTRMIAEVGYVFMATDLSVIDLTPALASQFATTSVTKNVGLIVYGVGLETMIYKNFGFRASYNVAPRMGTVDSTTSATSISNKTGTLTYSASPVLSMFYLGGILRFGF